MILSVVCVWCEVQIQTFESSENKLEQGKEVQGRDKTLKKKQVWEEHRLSS
jgi:hypothetical protein